jgi:molybdenum cofactor guanylyltransferase
MKITHITGVLLAGGKSRRMGNDKRTILIDGESLFNRALGVLKSVFQEVIVVLGEEDYPVNDEHIRVVHDIIPNRAAAGGLYTGLSYVTNSKIFVVACDMPFLNPEVIRYMATIANEVDITLAQLAHGPQTMHGIYSKSCLPSLEKMVKEENLRLQELLNDPSLRVRMVPESNILPLDPHLLSFMNLNSPADLELARKIKRSSL